MLSSTRSRNRANSVVPEAPSAAGTSLLIPENVGLVFGRGDEATRFSQENLDLPVGVVQPFLAKCGQPHPLLEETDRILELRLPRFELRDDAFQALSYNFV